ncbi:MAG: hypothetical protein ACXWO1_17055 [Isosphaeraceae bacterium]|jgi:hypothetical protein
MFDQRAFIERVERANTAEFARLMAMPTYEQEEALRAHFGGRLLPAATCRGLADCLDGGPARGL